MKPIIFNAWGGWEESNQNTARNPQRKQEGIIARRSISEEHSERTAERRGEKKNHNYQQAQAESKELILRFAKERS